MLFVSTNVCANGEKLLAQCKATKKETAKLSGVELYDSINCKQFIKGFASMGILYEVRLSDEDIKPFFCIPRKETTINQVVKIVTKYLEDHPERLSEDENILIIDALEQAFPCN